MSVLNKKPFIKTLLESMTTEDIGVLSVLMDGGGDRTPLLRTLNPNPVGNRSHITDADLGVHMCSLEVNFSQYNGYLIYNSDFCILLQFTDFQRIQMFNINPTKNTYELVDEYLDINELRSELDDTNQAEKVEIIDVVNQAIEDGEIEVGGLPEANAANKVLVSNSDLEFVEKDSVPLADMAENLTANPETNDALYSSGPTGGLADISTGEEAYLQEVKGYSIVWNQLMPDYTGTIQYVTTLANHVYIRMYKIGYSNQGEMTLIQNSTTSISNQTYKLFDLTLMFGGNDKIPFSLSSNVTEYPVNGSIPAQTYQPIYGFARLFANVDLINAPYDAGTIKNVSATKLVETGQNLFDGATMDGENGTGLQLLAGYRYEICQGTNYNNDHPSGWSNCVQLSYDGTHWSSDTRATLTRYQRADGKYVWTYLPTCNCYIKNPLAWDNNTYKLLFVGFVHSGNYCLTTGSNTNNNYGYSTENIPAFQKHEFNVNVSGLNGIPDDSDNHCSVYDTTDYKRVEKIDDLSTLTWTAGSGTYSTTISGIKPSTTHLLATKYLGSEMFVDENGVLTITTSSSPTGSLLYELAEPVSTGNPAFEPIPLKDSQGNWIVNDMGSEYFTGLDVCPVNQVSTYIENLKDKLVNLEIPEITGSSIIQLSYAGQYASSSRILYPALNQLKIGDQIYRLIPQGTSQVYATPQNENDYSNQLAIGASSSVSGHAIAIGKSAYANTASVVIGQSTQSGNGQYSVSVGYGTLSKAYYSVALGCNAVSYIQYGVSFDGTGAKSTCKTINLYDADKIFFRNAYQSSSYTSFASYTQGHYLSEYIQNNVMVNDGTDLTKFYPMSTWTDANNYQTFTKNVVSGTATAIDKLINGVHITVVLTDNDTTPTWHSVVGMDLMLYDSTNSLPYNSYARIDCGGTVEDIVAYIDADGCVVITAPTGTVISSVKYNIK